MILSLFGVISCFIYAFFRIRSLFSTIIYYLMNNSAIKKRKKGMTFKEWFTFSRFRTEIPHYHIVIYYIIIAVYIALFIITIIIHVTNLISDFNIYRTSLLAFTAILTEGYDIALEGFRARYTPANKIDKIHLKGIDKKAYREKMRKLNEKAKKEALKDKSETQENDSSVYD